MLTIHLTIEDTDVASTNFLQPLATVLNFKWVHETHILGFPALVWR